MSAVLLVLACASAAGPETLAAADAAMEARNYSEARDSYKLWLEEQVGADDEEVARAKVQLARTYFEQRAYTQAARWFAEVVDDHGTSAAAWDALYYGGITFVRMGQCAKATLYFGKIVHASVSGRGDDGAQYHESAEKHLRTIELDMTERHKLCPIGSAPGL